MADKWIQLQSADGTDNLFPKERWDILWENASPTSSFAGHSITFDWADHNTIYAVVFTQSTSSTYRRFVIFAEIGKGGIVFMSTNYNRFRAWNYGSGGLTFEDCYYYSTYNGTRASDNVNLLPYRVYAMKTELIDMR